MPTIVLLVVAALASGCAYGVRGGPEVQAYSGGPLVTHAAVTGFAGFGMTSRDGRNEGIGFAATTALGGDARQGGAAFSLLGGMEWFRVPDRAGRWGYRVGIDTGGCWRGPGLSTSELLVQLRGGPLFRLVDRESSQAPLITLGIEATLGAALSSPTPDTEEASVVAGVNVTVGAMHIGPFHL